MDFGAGPELFISRRGGENETAIVRKGRVGYIVYSPSISKGHGHVRVELMGGTGEGPRERWGQEKKKKKVEAEEEIVEVRPR